ncbi:MAG: hypothetical protein A2020_09750 [Lentisphaerae bacterium GWF2_45_14]|nr:MAG: hypothetical protein A2020_09750 [Lentisphaerae bacterium GWF2_45_14]
MGRNIISIAALFTAVCCFTSSLVAQEAPTAAPVPKPEQTVEQNADSGNKALRMTALYFPNRFLDTVDIFTLELGFGHEVALQPRITNYCKLIGFSGEKYFIGKGFKRQIGGGHTEGWEISAICLTASYRYLDETFGTFDDEFVYDVTNMHIPSPSNNVYKNKIEDFWGVGVFVGCLASVNVQIHPVEMADLITGIFLIDIANDDFKDSALITVE